MLLSSFIAAVLIFLGAAPCRFDGQCPFGKCIALDLPDYSHVFRLQNSRNMVSKNMMFNNWLCDPFFLFYRRWGWHLYGYPWFGLLSLIAQQIVTTLFGAIFLWSVTKWRPGLETSKEHIIKILKYARYISFNNSANLVNAQSDVFLLLIFCASPAGIYNAAKRLILSANLVMSSSIGQVSMPALSNASQDPEKLRKTYLDFVCLPACLLHLLCWTRQFIPTFCWSVIRPDMG